MLSENSQQQGTCVLWPQILQKFHKAGTTAGRQHTFRISNQNCVLNVELNETDLDWQLHFLNLNTDQIQTKPKIIRTRRTRFTSVVRVRTLAGTVGGYHMETAVKTNTHQIFIHETWLYCNTVNYIHCFINTIPSSPMIQFIPCSSTGESSISCKLNANRQMILIVSGFVFAGITNNWTNLLLIILSHHRALFYHVTRLCGL